MTGKPKEDMQPCVVFHSHYSNLVSTRSWRSTIPCESAKNSSSSSRPYLWIGKLICFRAGWKVCEPLNPMNHCRYMLPPKLNNIKELKCGFAAFLFHFTKWDADLKKRKPISSFFQCNQRSLNYLVHNNSMLMAFLDSVSWRNSNYAMD